MTAGTQSAGNPSPAVRSELAEWLLRDDSRLGDVYRLNVRDRLSAEETARRLGVATSGFVANYRKMIAALLEGRLPGTTLDAEVASRSRSIRRSSHLSAEAQRYLFDLESRASGRVPPGTTTSHQHEIARQRTGRIADFAEWSIRMAESEDLQAREEDDKRATARRVMAALELAQDRNDEWPEVLLGALASTNLVGWRFTAELRRAVQTDPAPLREALVNLMAAGEPEALDQFRSGLAGAVGQVTAGNATALGALVLMALDTDGMPPYSPSRTTEWYRMAGFDRPRGGDSPSSRYLDMLDFLEDLSDEIVELGRSRPSRLEAQGMAWAVSDYDPPAVWPEVQREAFLAFQGERQTSPRTRAWLVQGSAVGGHNLVPGWTAGGFVSLPGTNMDPLDPGSSLAEVAAVVKAAFPTRPTAYVKRKTDDYYHFVSGMNPGDLVVTTAEGQLHVGRIGEGMEWVNGTQLPTRLRRSAQWQSVVSWEKIPEKLRAALRADDDVVDLSGDIEIIKGLIPEEMPKPGGSGPKTTPAEATLAQPTTALAEEVFLPLDWLQRVTTLANRRRQIILYGPPGTGKTYLAQKLVEHWTEAGNSLLVQFHPSVAYEDFVAGYRPVDQDGQVIFQVKPGPLMRIAERARDNPTVPHVLVIDEINRANLAKVFGELYFLLEYRDERIEPLYADDDAPSFSMPSNLFILGTMNTADRSIALVDAAMRRRFGFVAMQADEEPVDKVLRRWLSANDFSSEAADLLDALNERIPDRDFRIGPSYLMKRWAYEDANGLEEVWESDLLPLLAEHHAGEGINVRGRYGLPALRKAIAATSPAEEAAQDIQ